MSEKKLGDKTVDEFLEEIERDLRRLDEKIEAQGDKIREDVKGFEDKFDAFMDENDFDMKDFRDKAGHELDRLKQELDFTAQALKKSFDHFRDQFNARDKKKD